MNAGIGKGFSSHTHTLKKTTNNNKSPVDRFISARQKMHSNELVISGKEILIHR